MLRLEILDSKDKVLSTHALHTSDDELVLLGRGVGVDVYIPGKGVGALHVAIKGGTKPVLMDLGGPTPVRFGGKEVVEAELDALLKSKPVFEIGTQRIRLSRPNLESFEIRKKDWKPVAEENDKTLVIRTRIYIADIAVDAKNSDKEIIIGEDLGLANPHKLVWIEGKKVLAQVPQEWLAMGGRIQVAKKGIAKLDEWATATPLELGAIYRVYAGKYLIEILIAEGEQKIGLPRPDFFPKELRKPFSISMLSVLLVFGIWMALVAKKEVEVEEPYKVYARIQNIPVEKIPEAPSQETQGGGGSGSQAQDTTAPQNGAPAQAAPSKIAQALTGGIKSLVGGVLSHSKSSTDAVVAESGISTAVAAGVAAKQTGQLAAVGKGAANIAGAAKLGNLGIKGSGQGFSGGSGTGLGTGVGSGIGSGVGQGIGGGGYKLVEEESIVDGGLDKSVIAAIIQNNLSQIKYCYERQLVAEPDLFGKVVARWEINAGGTVENTSVKQTTLNSTPVEQCMMGKISGWKFPQPKNGVRVTVTYPFLFKSTK